VSIFTFLLNCRLHFCHCVYTKHACIYYYYILHYKQKFLCQTKETSGLDSICFRWYVGKWRKINALTQLVWYNLKTKEKNIFKMSTLSRVGFDVIQGEYGCGPLGVSHINFYCHAKCQFDISFNTQPSSSKKH